MTDARAPSATTSVSAPPSSKAMFTSNPFSLALITWQVAMILLFSLCTTFSSEYLPTGTSSTNSGVMPAARYAMMQDTHVMMVVGCEERTLRPESFSKYLH